MNPLSFRFLAGLLLVSTQSFAHTMTPSDCDEMEFWNYDLGMCMPLPMEEMNMRMLMLHGNAFGVFTAGEEPRGVRKLASPNMFMADLGTSVGNRHYLNLDFMGTFEKWTVPENGYPELLQVGEEKKDRTPFIDSQHPHSSPIMGLTLSDTFSLKNKKDHLRFFFAPRGQSTDGPIAFMHRTTGQINPDAPLGHHVGQDVGHISSTVIGSALRLNETEIQISTFNGEEPKPTEVDLPIGTPNSYSSRLIQRFSPEVFAMISLAYVKDPEGHQTSLPHFLTRYSASVYNEHPLGSGWIFYNSLIYGLIHSPHAEHSLSSFGEEFLFKKNESNLWGRVETLERTPDELAISPVSAPFKGQWVTAATLGYTHDVYHYKDVQLSLGGSATHDFLPNDFESAYGGNPWTGKVFLQLHGTGSFD